MRLKPIVAIVGRSNVGKSTLFNRLVGRRQALVDDLPGVTRDRHYADADWRGYHYIVVDTGGIEIEGARSLIEKVRMQSLLAIREADAVICLFDATEGMTAVDQHIVEILRKTGKPVLYAVNKVDTAKHEDKAADFYSVGADYLIPISSEHGRGVDDLLDRLIERIKKFESSDPPTDAARVAVVGRPNVGKSTLINRIAGEERVIVHEEAGTTRDTIDVEIDLGGKKYVFVDTAGIKRKGKSHYKLEKFTTIKSLRAIGRADVVLVLTVAKDGITRQDMHLVSFAFTEKRPVIILVNKWDETSYSDEGKYLEYVRNSLGELRQVPVNIISAKTGYNCNKIFKYIEEALSSRDVKVSTSELNKALEEIVAGHHVPVYRGRPVKFFYCTQKAGSVPSFIIFTNYPEGIGEGYKRYMKNRLGEYLNLRGIPISLEFRKRR